MSTREEALEAAPCEVPLIERLLSVPKGARYEEGRSGRFFPVGRYCHEAAAALAQPVQPAPEPVAWRIKCEDGSYVYGDKAPLLPDDEEWRCDCLYAAPLVQPAGDALPPIAAAQKPEGASPGRSPVVPGDLITSDAAASEPVGWMYQYLGGWYLSFDKPEEGAAHVSPLVIKDDDGSAWRRGYGDSCWSGRASQAAEKPAPEPRERTCGRCAGSGTTLETDVTQGPYGGTYEIGCPDCDGTGAVQRPAGEGPFGDWHESVGWISTKHRLPEYGSTVLAFWSTPSEPVNGSNFATAVCATAQHWHDPGDDEDYFAIPSHWMPLPPPPTETQRPAPEPDKPAPGSTQ